MNKVDAKEQFNKLTKKLGIVHTFSFDEAWEWLEYKRNHIFMSNPIEFFPYNYSEEEFEAGITKVQNVLEKKGHPKEFGMKRNPVVHTFTDGQYIREIFNPAGQLIVTKIHKKEHPFFLMKGKMSILTEDGVVELEAPHHGITKPGTKRIIYTHTDCVFITVHGTDKKTPEEVEEEVIAKNFDDPVISIEEINLLKSNKS